jgi:hypothetical protein
VPKSNAERQAEWRERQRELDREGELALALEEDRERREERRKRYLADAELGARLTSRERGESAEVEGQRVSRAVRYARGRWEGFWRGDVAGL